MRSKDLMSPPAVIGALLLAACALFIIYFKSVTSVLDKTGALDAIVAPVFEKFGVYRRNMTRSSRGEASKGMRKYLKVSREYTAGDIDLKRLTKALEERLKQTAFKVSKRDYTYTRDSKSASYSISYKGLDVMSILIKSKRKAPAPVTVPKKGPFPNPKVAVVLDDFGYNTANIDKIFDMRLPITFSVLPNLKYSSIVSERASAKGYEVILHLPLEPQRKDVREEANSINSRLSGEEVLKRLKADLKSVPDAVGVSNHMGSKSTEEPELMEIIFRELKSRGLFFLDSLVTDDSCCGEVAGKVGIRFAKRGIFLDNEADEDYIKEKVLELKNMAFATGSCIAIGHDRGVTVKVLGRMLPELEKEGIRFVKVSELVD